MQRTILEASRRIAQDIKTARASVQTPTRWRDAPAFFQPGEVWPEGVWYGTPAGYQVGHKVGFSATPSVRGANFYLDRKVSTGSKSDHELSLCKGVGGGHARVRRLD